MTRTLLPRRFFSWSIVCRFLIHTTKSAPSQLLQGSPLSSALLSSLILAGWSHPNRGLPYVQMQMTHVFYCTPNHTRACLLNISTWTSYRNLKPTLTKCEPLEGFLNPPFPKVPQLRTWHHHPSGWRSRDLELLASSLAEQLPHLVVLSVIYFFLFVLWHKQPFAL